MPGIIVGNMPIEAALRKFKKQIEKSGLLNDMKKHEHYTKPSVKRKLKSIAARKRALKNLQA